MRHIDQMSAIDRRMRGITLSTPKSSVSVIAYMKMMSEKVKIINAVLMIQSVCFTLFARLSVICLICNVCKELLTVDVLLSWFILVSAVGLLLLFAFESTTVFMRNSDDLLTLTSDILLLFVSSSSYELVPQFDLFNPF